MQESLLLFSPRPTQPTKVSGGNERKRIPSSGSYPPGRSTRRAAHPSCEPHFKRMEARAKCAKTVIATPKKTNTTTPMITPPTTIPTTTTTSTTTTTATTTTMTMTHTRSTDPDSTLTATTESAEASTTDSQSRPSTHLPPASLKRASTTCPLRRLVETNRGDDQNSIGHVVQVIASIIVQLCDTSADRAQKVHTSGGFEAYFGTQQAHFCGVEPPAITIQDYLKRIMQYSGASLQCFVVALVYIDRLVEKQSKWFVNFYNVHRLLITSIMVAAKFVDDAYFNNMHYARMGGIQVKEINRLEVQLLHMLEYDLFVSPDLYRLYEVEIQRQLNPSPSPAPSPSPSPTPSPSPPGPSVHVAFASHPQSMSSEVPAALKPPYIIQAGEQQQQQQQQMCEDLELDEEFEEEEEDEEEEEEQPALVTTEVEDDMEDLQYDEDSDDYSEEADEDGDASLQVHTVRATAHVFRYAPPASSRLSQPQPAESGVPPSLNDLAHAFKASPENSPPQQPPVQPMDTIFSPRSMRHTG